MQINAQQTANVSCARRRLFRNVMKRTCVQVRVRVLRIRMYRTDLQTHAEPSEQLHIRVLVRRDGTYFVRFTDATHVTHGDNASSKGKMTFVCAAGCLLYCDPEMRVFSLPSPRFLNDCISAPLRQHQVLSAEQWPTGHDVT
jgi:hypothetical protein